MLTYLCAYRYGPIFRSLVLYLMNITLKNTINTAMYASNETTVSADHICHVM